jgi:hypothetical protein
LATGGQKLLHEHAQAHALLALQASRPEQLMAETAVAARQKIFIVVAAKVRDDAVLERCPLGGQIGTGTGPTFGVACW